VVPAAEVTNLKEPRESSEEDSSGEKGQREGARGSSSWVRIPHRFLDRANVRKGRGRENGGGSQRGGVIRKEIWGIFNIGEV